MCRSLRHKPLMREVHGDSVEVVGRPDNGGSADELRAAADKIMYVAKRSKRR
jgi:hypothetical protein